MSKGINSENWNAKIDSDRPVTMGRLPLSEHIEYERALQGSWDDVESLLHNYLVNDVGAVLTDLARTSVKSVEFARVFGPQGQILRGFLQRLDDQYAESGFKKIGGFYGSEHKLDVEAITNAVNSYFGRFGKSGGPVSKSIGATLSTLANFNMMDKVTLANIGDLIQPFQNSRHIWSAIQGLKSAKPFKENKLTSNLALRPLFQIKLVLGLSTAGKYSSLSIISANSFRNTWSKWICPIANI